MNKSDIVVSVSTITYNHARFLRQCLDGILMQDAPSCVPNGTPRGEWMELHIHDDCSTDGTQDIIREYMEKYPDVIKPIFETENQYSKGGPWGSAVWNFPRAKGKYIALCEGDDYWTDPLKLQKQVDFMEAHPDYSVCFHTFRNHIVQTDEYLEPAPTQLLQANGNPDGMDITLDMYFQKWYTQPMTMMFRTSAFSFEWQKQYKYYRDMHEIYHLLKVGKCRLMNFDGGVRNIHKGGISSMITHEQYSKISLPIDREFYQKNKSDIGPRQNLIDTLDTSIRVYANRDRKKALCLCFERFFVSHKWSRLYHQLRFVIIGKE